LGGPQGGQGGGAVFWFSGPEKLLKPGGAPRPLGGWVKRGPFWGAARASGTGQRAKGGGQPPHPQGGRFFPPPLGGGAPKVFPKRGPPNGWGAPFFQNGAAHGAGFWKKGPQGGGNFWRGGRGPERKKTGGFGGAGNFRGGEKKGKKNPFGPPLEGFGEFFLCFPGPGGAQARGFGSGKKTPPLFFLFSQRGLFWAGGGGAQKGKFFFFGGPNRKFFFFFSPLFFSGLGPKRGRGKNFPEGGAGGAVGVGAGHLKRKKGPQGTGFFPLFFFSFAPGGAWGGAKKSPPGAGAGGGGGGGPPIGRAKFLGPPSKGAPSGPCIFFFFFFFHFFFFSFPGALPFSPQGPGKFFF